MGHAGIIWTPPVQGHELLGSEQQQQTSVIATSTSLKKYYIFAVCLFISKKIMHLNKIKILLIGPSGSGKSLIANFISESLNIEDAGAPRPTQGVRIVEFELSNINVNDKIYNNDIELWDCSGDHRFESCWPALRVGLQGVILVCSPSTAHAATREMELLYNYFVSQSQLSSKQCVLFYNVTDDQDDLESLNLSPTFSKVSQVAINLKTGGNRLKIEFSNFVVSILQTINKS